MNGKRVRLGPIVVGLIAGTIAGVASGNDCEFIDDVSYQSPPTPAIPTDPETRKEIDSAFQERTKSWWDYAKSVEQRDLRCTFQEYEVTNYYDGETLVRQKWHQGADQYFRDGKLHLSVHELSTLLRIVEYYENGTRRFAQFQVGDEAFYVEGD